MLADKVRAHLKDRTILSPDPVLEMVNTLFKIAKAKLPEKEGRQLPMSPMDVVVAALQNREEYFEVWDEAKKVFKEKYGDDFEGIEDYMNHYLSQPYPQVLVTRAVQQFLAKAKVDVDSAIAGK